MGLKEYEITCEMCGHIDRPLKSYVHFDGHTKQGLCPECEKKVHDFIRKAKENDGKNIVYRDELTYLAEKFWGFRGTANHKFCGIKAIVDGLKKDIKNSRKRSDKQFVELVQEIAELQRRINR